MTDYLTNENQEYYNTNPIKQKEIDRYRKIQNKQCINQCQIDKVDAEISALKIQRFDINLQLEKLNRKRNKLCGLG